jgi:hypothetical protein
MKIVCLFSYFHVGCIFPASTVVGVTSGAGPKPGDGDGCIKKGIWHKIVASATAQVFSFHVVYTCFSALISSCIPHGQTGGMNSQKVPMAAMPLQKMIFEVQLFLLPH